MDSISRKYWYRSNYAAESVYDLNLNMKQNVGPMNLHLNHGYKSRNTVSCPVFSVFLSYKCSNSEEDVPGGL